MAASQEHARRIREAFAAVTAGIETAVAASGRSAGSVRLLPVSKTFPSADILVAMDLGLRRFGENKVQEALGKFEQLGADPAAPEWAVIGHLQTNKAKYVARFATEFQALDGIELATALQRRLDSEQRELEVLVQVNTSGEASKSGVEPEGLLQLVSALRPLDRLRLRGVMTIATRGGDERENRRCFALLRELRDAAQHETGAPLPELSMGMSADFAQAIDEGATVVRIGSALFGARPPVRPDRPGGDRSPSAEEG